jgi:hypothetical protein
VLAGVSTDYYAQLERGNLTGVSDSVLDAIARALQLDEAEHAHLHNLAHAANTTSHTRRRAAPKHQIRPVVQRILDGMTAMPAIVMNGRLDLLSSNRLGYALYAPVYDGEQSRPVNLARFIFLNPHATALYPHCNDAADTTVAMLRTEAGRHPYDRELSDLIGELSTRSDAFRKRWAAYNVLLHRSGTKRFHHPVIGDVSFAYEVMELSADTGLTLTAYSPEPNSSSQDALTLLASCILCARAIFDWSSAFGRPIGSVALREAACRQRCPPPRGHTIAQFDTYWHPSPARGLVRDP